MQQQLGDAVANATATIRLDDLRSVAAMVAKHPTVIPSAATLRWQLRHRDRNGLAPACVRLGKKLLISETRYEAWLATRAGAA